jgi:hypothetical protein
LEDLIEGKCYFVRKFLCKKEKNVMWQHLTLINYNHSLFHVWLTNFWSVKFPNFVDSSFLCKYFLLIIAILFIELLILRKKKTLLFMKWVFLVWLLWRHCCSLIKMKIDSKTKRVKKWTFRPISDNPLPKHINTNSRSLF